MQAITCVVVGDGSPLLFKARNTCIGVVNASVGPQRKIMQPYVTDLLLEWSPFWMTSSPIFRQSYF